MNKCKTIGAIERFLNVDKLVDKDILIGMRNKDKRHISISIKDLKKIFGDEKSGDGSTQSWNNILPDENGNISANSGDLPHITRIKSDYEASEGAAILLTEEQYNELISSPTGTIEVGGETFFREYEMDLGGQIGTQKEIYYGEIIIPDGTGNSENVIIPEQTCWVFELNVESDPDLLSGEVSIFYADFGDGIELAGLQKLVYDDNGEIANELSPLANALGLSSLKSPAFPPIICGIIPGSSTTEEKINNLDSEVENLKAEIEALKEDDKLTSLYAENLEIIDLGESSYNITYDITNITLTGVGNTYSPYFDCANLLPGIRIISIANNRSVDVDIILPTTVSVSPGVTVTTKYPQGNTFLLPVGASCEGSIMIQEKSENNYELNVIWRVYE